MASSPHTSHSYPVSILPEISHCRYFAVPLSSPQSLPKLDLLSQPLHHHFLHLIVWCDGSSKGWRGPTYPLRRKSVLPSTFQYAGMGGVPGINRKGGLGGSLLYPSGAFPRRECSNWLGKVAVRMGGHKSFEDFFQRVNLLART